MHGLRDQGAALFTAVLLLVGILVVVQLWLVTAALEALLSGHPSVLMPAALASLALLGLNGALLLFVFRLDQRIRRAAGPPE